MPTLNAIWNELQHVPVNRLEDLYSIIHSLQLPSPEPQKAREDILSFGGAFSDLPIQDFEEYQSHTEQVRNELFNRDATV